MPGTIKVTNKSELNALKTNNLFHESRISVEHFKVNPKVDGFISSMKKKRVMIDTREDVSLLITPLDIPTPCTS